MEVVKLAKTIRMQEEFEEEQLDLETGELNKTKKTIFKSFKIENDEPPFIKLYLDTLLLNKEISINRNPILNELLKMMPYASSEISYFALNKDIKMRIADKVGLSLQTVNNAITEFVKHQILIRVGRGTYQPNPFYFGKGEWKDVKKVRTQLEFDNKGVNFLNIDLDRDEDKGVKNESK